MQASHVSINHHPSYGHSSSIPLLDGIDPFSNPKDRGFSLNWVFHVKFQCTLIFCLVVSSIVNFVGSLNHPNSDPYSYQVVSESRFIPSAKLGI